MTKIFTDSDQDTEHGKITGSADVANDKESIHVAFSASIKAQPQRHEKDAAVEKPDPTRFGDWEINGRCIDF